MDERNQAPNITLGNTRPETLRFGGAGVQNILSIYRIVLNHVKSH